MAAMTERNPDDDDNETYEDDGGDGDDGDLENEETIKELAASVSAYAILQ